MVEEWAAGYGWAEINITVAGDKIIVEGHPGKKIRVVSACFTSTGAVKVAWKSGSTIKIPAMNLTAANGFWIPRACAAIVCTEPGEPLILSTSSGADLAGYLEYRLES